MKKLTALFLAAGMVMAASAPASAVDVKFDGNYQFTFEGNSAGFTGANTENVQQRLRLGATFAASENLSGYIQFQFGTDEWGTRNYKHGTYDKQVAARLVYIDWKVPGTPVQVRMGRQLMALPSEAFGSNSVLCGGDSGFLQEGIVVSAPVTDWLGLTALWSRANISSNYDTAQGKNDDFFAVAADLKFNGVSGAVYGAYALVDTGANDSFAYGWANMKGEGEAYWVGATATVSAFDPFTLKLSAVYGEFDADTKGNDAEGWNIQAKASYAMDFGTPVVGAWYAAGTDKDDAAKGKLPSIGGYFYPTRTYFDGGNSLQGGIAKGDANGTWGVQAGIEGMSFIKDLSHDFLLTYVAGTNEYVEKAGKANTTATALTDEDALFEIDFISHYNIYKNLVAHFEISYIINDLNDKAYADDVKKMDEDDWRIGLTFQYKF